MSDDPMFGPPQPHDIEAERHVLSAMIGSPVAVEQAAERLDADDFYRPAHQVLFREIVTMWAAQEKITPITIRAWLQANDLMRPFGDQGPVYLAELFGLHSTTATVLAHAEIVRDRSIRRRITETGLRLMQYAGQLSEDVTKTLATAEQEVTQVIRRSSVDSVLDELTAVEAFITRDFARREPVIPGLLDHEDRVVVVATEGAGKSTLARQVAAAAAAGVHPFMNVQIRPIRTLVLDLENPRALIQRALRQIMETAAQQKNYRPGGMMVWAHPSGVDLRDPRDSYLVADVIRRAQPELIVAGPIYKMITDNGDSAERTHSIVTRFWDLIRERTGAALWLETHAPIAAGGRKQERDLRPHGSGIWSRWPEFGIAMKQTGDIEVTLDRFRGDREEGRQWPVTLTRNLMAATYGWPWQATWAPGTLDRPLNPEGDR